MLPDLALSASIRRMPGRRAAVSAAFFANGFVVGSWAPQVPVFAERLALSETALGLFLLGFGIGAILAMPVVGAVTARTGSRVTMVGLGLLLAFALPLIAAAETHAFAAFAVIFAGLVIGGQDVAMNANAVSVERSLSYSIMSSCHGFWSLGGLAGAAFGGILIAAFGAFPHGAIVALATLILMAFSVRHALDDRLASTPASTDEGVLTAAEPLRAGRHAALTAVAIGLFALFCMIPEGAILDWGALYLEREIGAGTAMSGFAFAAFSLTMAAMRFLGDGLRDRFGAVRIVRLSSFSAALGLLIVGVAEATATALLGFALIGIGLSNMVPIAFSAAGNLRGLKPGIGISIVTTFGYSGILVAPSAIGFVADRTGLAPVFLGLAALLVLVLASARIVAGADRAKTP